jgi:hypothetical protein
VTDPQRLVDELTRHGWAVVGRGRHYARLTWPGINHNARTLVVPLDTAAPEFQELWEAARGQMESAVDVGVKAAHALAGLHAPPIP